MLKLLVLFFSITFSISACTDSGFKGNTDATPAKQTITEPAIQDSTPDSSDSESSPSTLPPEEDRTVAFDLESYHVGDGVYSRTGDCDFGRDVSVIYGRTFRFEFRVLKDNTDVTISVARACVGPDFYETLYSSTNTLSLLKEGVEYKLIKKLFTNQVSENNIVYTTSLPQGTYHLQFFTTGGSTPFARDGIHFVVDGIRVVGNKELTRGQVSTIP